MSASQVAAHNFGSAWVASLLVATLFVVFWRTVIRFVLMIVAIMLVALIGTSALMLAEITHRM